MKHRSKRLLSILLSLVMLLGMLPGMSLTAYAATNYDDYIPSQWDEAEQLAGKMVNFNGHKWYVISHEGETITLLAADTSFGIARFTDGTENDYSQSKIRETLDGMTAKGGSFADVADAIEEISFSDTFGTAKLYLLNADEVSGLPINVVKMNFTGGDASDGQWWLRSPDPDENGNSMCAYVKEAENEYGITEEMVIKESKFVEHYFGVRPALKLNLSKVTFDSTSKTFSVSTVSVTGVTLDKTTAQTIDVDGKVSFTATVEPDGATDQTVKWSVGGTDTGAVKLYTDEACTTEVGADATDTLTVYAKGISAGSATVTATSNADSTKTASCNVTVNETQQQSGGTDVLTRDDTGITGTSYGEWSGVTKSSGAVYAGQSAGGNESIQLRSNNDNSGIVTTTSGGKATKVSVIWNNNTTNGRTLNVYGKNSAYSAASDLYGSDKGDLLGTIVYGQSTELTISGDYTYIGMRSNSGAMYLDSIAIEWGGSTPATVAVTGVTLNPSAAQTIDVNGTVSFTATVEPNGATDKKVKWSVGGANAGAVKLYSDEACNNEVGAEATETLTVYAKGISAGSATVTATSNADSTKSASCNVQVNAAAQEASADLRKAIVDFFTPFDCEFVKELIQGDSFGGYPVRGSVSATYNGENADIAYSPTSENSADITISHGGNELRFSVSIETDPETGDSTTVVGPVTYTGDEPTAFSLSFDPAAIDLDGSVRTSVYPAPVAVTSVSLDKTEAQSIDVDGKVSFTATVSPEEATDKTVKWSVGGTDTGAVKLYSDEACKNEVGTAATSTLTVYAKGISAGSATVTVTSNADATKSASCNVTVNAAVSDNPYASLLNTTTVVKFDNKDWYLIENNSTALNAGTVTLLSKECVAASKYNSSGSYVEYASSTVKTAVDNYYTNSISSNVKTAIVDNKMFLLTKDQANAITNAEVGKCSQFSGTAANYWWLCSPDSIDNYAACVRGADGYVTDNGSGVWVKLGVRPALKLDLSKVTFDSASKTFTVSEAASDNPYASLLNTTTVVKFDNKDWYLIENNSTALNAGTVTLLAKECVAASQYNSSGSYVEYASSTVKTAVDNYYTNSISSNVKTAIVDNKMFLLTTDQANTIMQANPEVLKCNKANGADDNAWWLCSPGGSDSSAACVYGGIGSVDGTGGRVRRTIGVRPALKLDLSKVSFDSTSNTFATAAPALDPVSYLAWDDTQKKLVEKKDDDACKDYTVVTADTTAFETGKWYVVTTSTDITKRITVTGTANLILMDGATLNAQKGITVNNGKTLNIYAQSTDKAGALTAGNSGAGYAAIGGSMNNSGGAVNIHGGTVNATGGTSAAGIGGGQEGDGGSVAIYGGSVTATGGSGAMGIGKAVDGSQNGTLTLGTGVGMIVSTDNTNWSAYTGSNRAQYMKTGVAHIHDFTYSADGATITATCGAANCGLTSNPTLTIVAPTMTVYQETGKSEVASLTGLQDFNTATGKSLAVTNIKYVGRDGTEYTESTTAPTNAGKYTATITLSGVKTAEGDDKSVAASVDYSIKYAVTFNTNGGSAVPQQLVEAGESATRPTDPTREGNIFGGWFADADFAESYVFDEVTENTTVYAKWGEHRVTWTVGRFSLQDVFTGNAPAADSNTTVNMVAEHQKPDGATLSWKTETDVSGDVTHTAQFSFPVTLNVNGGTINAGNVESYIYGTGATLPTDVTRAKYDFGGWYANSELTGTAVTQIGTTATGSKEFWAKWTAVYAVPATVTANNRTYDGTEKPLVTVTGEATGGEMQYAIGTATEATEPYTTSIPAKTDVGTYYVWYKVVGDSNHNDTTPVCVEVTISNRPTPSGGGSSTPATVTIPVSGEGKDAETVNVTVQVTGATATVTSADVDKVLEAKDVGNVTVNVESLNKNVDEVVLPAALVEKVAKAVADNGNDASGLEIKLPTGTVTFDATTVATLAQQSNGKDLKVHLDNVSQATLTSAQQNAVKDVNALVVLDAYVTADGKRISDFSGGKATFSVPVELKDGQVPEGVVAFFVDEKGNMTEIPCSCDGNTATGTVEHFSNYVVTYDESRVTKPEPQPEPEPEPTPGPATPTDIGYDDLSDAQKKDADAVASALGVDKDTAAQMVKLADELGVSIDTVKLSGAALAKMNVDSSDPAGTDFGNLTARVTKRTNSALTLKWTKQKNADGYLIYGNKCGKGNKMKLLKTIKKNGTVSYTQKKLKKGTYYKYMVVAYKNVNGQKMPIAASVVIHVPTKGGKTTVAKSVKTTQKVKKKDKAVSSVSVKKGKSVTIKATEVLEEKKLKAKTHRVVKFESSNPKIAKVNAKGKITGKKKGKATVWAYAQNGIFKAIQVTVK